MCMWATVDVGFNQGYTIQPILNYFINHTRCSCTSRSSLRTGSSCTGSDPRLKCLLFYSTCWLSCLDSSQTDSSVTQVLHVYLTRTYTHLEISVSMCFREQKRLVYTSCQCLRFCDVSINRTIGLHWTNFKWIRKWWLYVSLRVNEP